jgi:hypothetical protein
MGRTLRWTPGVAVPVATAVLACVNVVDVKVPLGDERDRRAGLRGGLGIGDR